MLPRLSEPIGWDSTAFQVWDGMRVWKPLQLPSVPLLGRYGPDLFPGAPFVLIEIPVTAARSFPAELKGVIADRHCATSVLEVFLLVHPAMPKLEQEEPGGLAADELNVLLHAWALREVEDLESHQSVQVDFGVFPIHGLAPVQADRPHVGISALWGGLREGSVIIHDLQLSPDNFQIRLLEGTRLAYFFSMAVLSLDACGEGSSSPRVVVTLHVLPTDEPAEDLLRAAVAEAADVAQLRERLPQAISELEGSVESGGVTAVTSLMDSALGVQVAPSSSP